jgi:hypothetical protein
MGLDFAITDHLFGALDGNRLPKVTAPTCTKDLLLDNICKLP